MVVRCALIVCIGTSLDFESRTSGGDIRSELWYSRSWVRELIIQEFADRPERR